MANKVQVGFVYHTDGTVTKIVPEDGKKFRLNELQEAVGGYIELLISGITHCKQLYCNEEGQLLNLPRNPHTWAVVNAEVYKLNGYKEGFWSVQGDILAVLNEDPDNPISEHPHNGRKTELAAK